MNREFFDDKRNPNAIIINLSVLAMFNFFWTAIYVWPHTHGSDQHLRIIGIIIMFFGGFSILSHIIANAYVVM